MTVQDFIDKWKYGKNLESASTVRIIIAWHKIHPESKVTQLKGKSAWKKIYSLQPPHLKHENGVRMRIKDLIATEQPAYIGLIAEVLMKGKLKDIQETGLQHPTFCAVVDTNGRTGVLADGNHRFLYSNYLISQGADFTEAIKRATLDIVYVDNLSEVVPYDIPEHIPTPRITPTLAQA